MSHSINQNDVSYEQIMRPLPVKFHSNFYILLLTGKFAYMKLHHFHRCIVFHSCKFHKDGKSIPYFFVIYQFD